jgi:proline-specific peptidase
VTPDAGPGGPAVTPGGPGTEGYLPVPGGMVWYRCVGDGPGLPLLVVHGGPGAGSDYLGRLGELGTGRRVVFYDQLGCGRSKAPDGPGLNQLARFVAELRAVRRMLGLRRVHLFGHSWGGWLALEYLSGKPDGVASVTLASTSASLAEHIRELARLRAELPAATVEALDRYEERGELSHPDYRAALLEFYQRHVCRLTPWPRELMRTALAMAGSGAYQTLVGPNELVVTGTMRDWDRGADLAAITVPTLVTVGRYDEITPACARTLHSGLPDARLVEFAESAHMPHLEEPERYLAVLGDFLAGRDDDAGRDEDSGARTAEHRTERQGGGS